MQCSISCADLRKGQGASRVGLCGIPSEGHFAVAMHAHAVMLPCVTPLVSRH